MKNISERYKYSDSKNSIKNFKIKKFLEVRRFKIFYAVFLIFVLIIFLSFANTQILNGKRLRKIVIEKQTRDELIKAKRGNIFDRNGEVLAHSLDVDTVTINPYILEAISKEKITLNSEQIAQKFSEIFGDKKEEYKKQIEAKSGYEVIARKVEKTKIDKLKAWLKSLKKYNGIDIVKDVKRNYPYNVVASNILGFCNIDNVGIEGLEATMNTTLSGISGRRVAIVDANRNPLKDGLLKNIKPEDGKNIYLTIDIKLQSIAEKAVKNLVESKKADDGVGLIMDVKTGEILAMANYPSFNSNSPFEPVRMKKEEWDKLDSKKKADILADAFHNKSITMLYEPGSVFKIVTAAIGLEEGKTEESKTNDFICTGSQRVAEWNIRCWQYPRAHGSETLTQALGNSCNPAFIQLIQRIGVNPLFKYLEGFGFFKRTGIEATGEATPLFFKKEDVGIVELSTISFGQRFLTTPIQMLKIVTSIVNNGEVVNPTLIYKIEDADKRTFSRARKKEVKKIISKRTSEQIRRMLKNAVENASASAVRISGYSIGGKSGTSEPNYLRPEEGYVGSFFAITPAEDPKYAIFSVVRNPKVGNRGGGATAGVIVKEILKELKRIEN